MKTAKAIPRSFDWRRIAPAGIAKTRLPGLPSEAPPSWLLRPWMVANGAPSIKLRARHQSRLRPAGGETGRNIWFRGHVEKAPPPRRRRVGLWEKRGWLPARALSSSPSPPFPGQDVWHGGWFHVWWWGGLWPGKREAGEGGACLRSPLQPLSPDPPLSRGWADWPHITPPPPALPGLGAGGGGEEARPGPAGWEEGKVGGKPAATCSVSHASPLPPPPFTKVDL